MSKLFVTTEGKRANYKEGDIWTENGKEWTIKNGLKRTVSRMDAARKQVFTPLACPICKGTMKHQLDEKMWIYNKRCFSCTVEMEHEIRKAGKWEEYESGVMNDNKNAMLDDLEMALENWVEEKDTFVSESGEVEKWGGGDKTSIYKEVKEQIAKLKNEKVS